VHNGRVRRTAPALAVLAALLAAAPPPADAALRFKRCGGFGLRCTRLAVPLDRSGRVPGRVSLFVERLRARRRPRVGATFVLAGGPGQSATDSFQGDGLGELYPTYRNRDLIIFDQRGTGRSGLLRCRLLERSNLLRAGGPAADCAARLGLRRAFYTTRDSVEDIEAIRRQLGIGRIALFGTSYGTKVALAYALRYPGNVDRLLLDSVVEANGPDPLYRDTFAAAPRVLRALCRVGCGRVTRDPVADVQRLVARLATGPLFGPIVDARGRRHRGRLGREDVFISLLSGDFDPTLRAAFPAAVRSALAGDAAPMLRLKRRALQIDARPPPPRSLSSALYAATTCEETDFPWARTASPLDRLRSAQSAAGAVPDSRFVPFDRATALGTDLIDLCHRWPASPARPALAPGPLPDVPVLLLEGEDDLRTPVENARRVASSFPHARLLVAGATGHSVLGSDASGCTARAFSKFFLGRALPTHCRRARREFRPLPIAPTALRRVEPLGRLRGLRGRALTAVALTLRDVSDEALTSVIADQGLASDLARGGGLRGGRYRVNSNNTATLRSVVYVPGVRVSGRIKRFGERRQHGRLRVAGRGFPRGALVIRGRRIRGRLGRHRVRDVLRPATSPPALQATVARLPGPRGR
jgi:pimeloyl-ACP methyl ester carboxylesterase